MSDMEIREEFREVNAELSRIGRSLAVARERAESASTNAAVAVAPPSHGVELLLRRYGEALGDARTDAPAGAGHGERCRKRSGRPRTTRSNSTKAMIEPRLEDGKLGSRSTPTRLIAAGALGDGGERRALRR